VGRPLALEDIEAAAELWRHAYPEIYGSSHDCMLYPEDYKARMALVQTWEEDSLRKPCCMLVVQGMATGADAAASLAGVSAQATRTRAKAGAAWTYFHR
jgi:hypothetical protein